METGINCAISQSQGLATRTSEGWNSSAIPSKLIQFWCINLIHISDYLVISIELK